MDKLPLPSNKFNLNTTKAFYDRMNIAKNFKLQAVEQASILKMLKKTNVNKAPGIDKLTGIFIRDGADLLAAPLTQVINLSIATSTFPDPCKIAKLRGLLKKGSKTDPKKL